MGQDSYKMLTPPKQGNEKGNTADIQSHSRLKDQALSGL